MFKPISVHEIPGKRPKGFEVNKEIEKFLLSNHEAVELVIPDGKSPDSLATAFRTCANQKKYPIAVVQRSRRVFLIRKDFESAE